MEAAKGLAEVYWTEVSKVPTRPGLTQSKRVNWEGAILRAKVRKSGANARNANF